MKLSIKNSLTKYNLLIPKSVLKGSGIFNKRLDTSFANS
jgi:hypothetical protein